MRYVRNGVLSLCVCLNRASSLSLLLPDLVSLHVIRVYLHYVYTGSLIKVPDFASIF